MEINIKENIEPGIYDVVICGGGLAGLSLARQLKLSDRAIRILILEKNQFPVREAAFKVGESTVEIAGFYFREVLALKTYLKNDQYIKAGLRYFFKQDNKHFSQYPEIGLSGFASVDSYQIDRGKLENDLADLNKLDGVDILDGVAVTDIKFDPGARHSVTYGGKDNAAGNVLGRWVIDATGRRSLIQKKLALRKQVESECSAVWFRVKGRFDVSDFVPAENKEWHRRVPYKIRYYSTTHLMGNGFWIWIIPLINNNTSLGIVIDEKLHSYAQLNTLAKAKEWIKNQYPVIADRLELFEVLDFLGLRHYSYSSKQVFSTDRWACTGEAAFFPDPFYSPGSNLIGLGNSAITKLILDDLKTGIVPAERVNFYNQFMISQNEWLITDIQTSYAYFGNSQVESLSYLWDVIVGWTIAAPQMFNMIFLEEEKFMRVREVINSFSILSARVRKLFIEWSGLSKGTFSFTFIDYLSVPFIKALYDRVLVPGKSTEQLVADYQLAMKYIEEFVQVLFHMILEDCMPGTIASLPKPYWINVWAVSLSPDRWEKDHLFSPRTAMRNLSEVEEQIRGLFIFNQVAKHEKTKQKAGQGVIG